MALPPGRNFVFLVGPAPFGFGPAMHPLALAAQRTLWLLAAQRTVWLWQRSAPFGSGSAAHLLALAAPSPFGSKNATHPSAVAPQRTAMQPRVSPGFLRVPWASAGFPRLPQALGASGGLWGSGYLREGPEVRGEPWENCAPLDPVGPNSIIT